MYNKVIFNYYIKSYLRDKQMQISCQAAAAATHVANASATCHISCKKKKYNLLLHLCGHGQGICASVTGGLTAVSAN